MEDSETMLAKAKELLKKYEETVENDFFETASVPDHLSIDLQALLKKQQSLKAEHDIIEQQMILRELQKEPDQYLTLAEAEAELAESEDILQEVNSFLNGSSNELHEKIAVSMKAFDDLKANVLGLSQKSAALEKKYKELVGSNNGFEQPTAVPRVEASISKVKSLLTVARREQELAESRLLRLQSTIETMENMAMSVEGKESIVKKEVERLHQHLTFLEQISGIRCTVQNEHTVDIEFLQDHEGSDCHNGNNENKRLSSGSRLKVTLIFRSDEDDCLELTDVQTNQSMTRIQDLTTQLMKDKDIPKFINDLKIIWTSHIPLLTEITELRQRHAIDWVKEEGLLRLMVSKGNAVVCTLKIPVSYPHNGLISLENIMGCSKRDVEDIPAPDNVSLTGWIHHLEKIYGRP